jgi:hypothetical protein
MSAEAPKPVQDNGYQRYVTRQIEALNSGETKAVYAWLKDRLSHLPEMKVSAASVTEGDKWKHTMTPEGQVQQIQGAHFTVEGRNVQTPSFSWSQPGVINTETGINLPTPQGVQRIDASGFVGVIRDAEGNVLLTVGQEPLAQTPNKAVVKTPFQTSATKLQGLIQGQKELDPNLAEVFSKVSNKPIAEMFSSGDITTFALPPADANRIQATNMGFALTVSDAEVRESLVSEGKNRWCTPDEAKALARAGIVNGHTAAALLSVL